MKRFIALVEHPIQVGPEDWERNLEVRFVEDSDTVGSIMGWAMRVSGNKNPQLRIVVEAE